MCVICYKGKKDRMPTVEEIVSMWETNPHGAGVMWRNDDNTVGWQKGFMTLSGFKDWFKRSESYLKDRECALHFRITTHGGTSEGNTHPFNVARRANPHKQRGVGLNVLMHNGILAIEPRRKDISDSAELALRAGIYPDPSAFLSDISELLRGSRIILFGANGTKFFGDDFIEHNGLKFSNLHFLNRPFGFGSSNFACYDDNECYWDPEYWTGTGRGEWVSLYTGAVVKLEDVNPEYLCDADYKEWEKQIEKLEVK